MSLSRRVFVTAFVALGVPQIAPATRLARATAAERLRFLVGVPASARVIGQLYHATDPQDAACAATALFTSLPPRARYCEDAMLRALLVKRIRRDFDEGATVNVSGYILSRTEARLAALWA
jgi:hypothetical protein